MSCRRSACNNPIPEGRRKFCSDECARLFHSARRRTTPMRQVSKENVLDAGMRVCLGCDAEFLSDGPWNRLCPKCKRREIYQ